MAIRVSFSMSEDIMEETLSEPDTVTCAVCKDAVIDSGNLDKHMKIHNRRNPLSCKYCEHFFSIVSILKKHIRIHTGEKPFSCKGGRWQ